MATQLPSPSPAVHLWHNFMEGKTERGASGPGSGGGTRSWRRCQKGL